MFCYKCGRDNPSGARFCVFCHNKLVDMSMFEQKKEEVAVTDGRYKVVKQYCDLVIAGTITVEQFGEFISSTYHQLLGIASEIYSFMDESNYASFGEEEINTGYKGVDLWLNGLMELYSYVSTYDTEHITNGLAMIEEGNGLINDAMSINRASRNSDSVIGTV